MIRYDITLQDLQTRIENCKPNWHIRVANATTQFRNAGRYEKPPEDFWGEIKTVYIALQHGKCAFCERDLEWIGDYQVEHFRPKGRVKSWPPPRTPQYSFPTGAILDSGYYLLTYHPLNYTASCGKCNVGLKRDYFPIEGDRNATEENPANLQGELPLLIYPISDIDVDPETLIHFAGVIPKPVIEDITHHDNHRARVTIDFFRLEGRDAIRKARAGIIQELFLALKYREIPSTRLLAEEIIHGKTNVESPHCNCARSFVRLFEHNPQRAEALAEEAREWLNQHRRRLNRL